MTNTFAAPGLKMRVHWHELSGTLVAIQPLAAERTIATSEGSKRLTIPANIYIIDGPRAGQVISNTMIFPPGIRAAVRQHVGQLVLGRVTQGAPPADGMLPPWTFTDATCNPADVALATSILNRHNH